MDFENIYNLFSRSVKMLRLRDFDTSKKTLNQTKYRNEIWFSKTIVKNETC